MDLFTGTIVALIILGIVITILIAAVIALVFGIIFLINRSVNDLYFDERGRNIPTGRTKK